MSWLQPVAVGQVLQRQLVAHGAPQMAAYEAGRNLTLNLDGGETTMETLIPDLRHVIKHTTSIDTEQAEAVLRNVLTAAVAEWPLPLAADQLIRWRDELGDADVVVEKRSAS